MVSLFNKQMKRNDIIFAIVCGLSVSWIAIDFFGKYGFIFCIIFPILSVGGLLLCDILGRKFLFIHQAGKFALAGAFADVIDIKVFQLLFLLAPFSLIFKGISFLVATFIKYWTNKHWAFEKHEKDGMSREAAQFFLVTLIGLAIDIVSFYYFGKIETGLPIKTWTELNIIFAALIASVWNFCGYKFIVFKK